jgi:hypothetical protein
MPGGAPTAEVLQSARAASGGDGPPTASTAATSALANPAARRAIRGRRRALSR